VQQKRHGCQGQCKNDVTPKTTKGRTFGKKCWKGLEYKIGIKNPGTIWQLHLKIKRTLEGFDRKAFGLEFVQQATGMSSELWKVKDWTVWSGRRPLEQENKDRTLWIGRPPPKWKNLLALLAMLA
jgi:hypothetical protein